MKKSLYNPSIFENPTPKCNSAALLLNTLLISQVRTMITQHIFRKIKHKNKKQSMFMYVHRKFLQRKEKKKKSKGDYPNIRICRGINISKEILEEEF